MIFVKSGSGQNSDLGQDRIVIFVRCGSGQEQ